VEYPRQKNGASLRFLSSVDAAGASAVGPPGGTDADVSDLPTYWGLRQVIVDEEDVRDLHLVVSTGTRLCGHIEFDGDTGRPSAEILSGADVWIIRLDQFAAETPITKLTSDGRFCSVGLEPGKYQVRIVGGFQRWWLRSVQQGGRQVTAEALDLDAHAVMTFTDRNPELTGVVRNAKGDPVPNATVLLFPRNEKLWLDSGPRPLMVRSTRADLNGVFRFPNPIEGSYRVVALSAPVPQTWMLIENLQLLSPLAAEVQVQAGGPSTINLTAKTTPFR